MIVYKSSMAGPYHKERGIPCQDSWAAKQGKDSFIIAAVADGLGSQLYSHVGSSVAVQTAVDYCAQFITAKMTFHELKKTMRDAFVCAYQAVLSRAKKDGNPSDEYDTTLCLAAYNGEHLYYAQSGDSGMVALLENGEYRRITAQQRDSEGRVFPLCWGPEKWEFGFVDSAVSAVMLMTDGVFEQICPPLMRRREIDVNIALARKFLDLFDCVSADIPPLEAAVYKYLENYPKRLLDDDKTIVVLINTERKPAQKDASYYAIPDWNALQDEAKKQLAAYDRENAVSSTTAKSLSPDGARSFGLENAAKDTADMAVSEVADLARKTSPLNNQPMHGPSPEVFTHASNHIKKNKTS